MARAQTPARQLGIGGPHPLADDALPWLAIEVARVLRAHMPQAATRTLTLTLTLTPTRTGSLPGKWPRGARARSTLRPLTSNSMISAYCRRAGRPTARLPAGPSSRPCSQKLLTGPPTKVCTSVMTIGSESGWKSSEPRLPRR